MSCPSALYTKPHRPNKVYLPGPDLALATSSILRTVLRMKPNFPTKIILAFVIGLIVGSVSTFFILSNRADDGHFHTHDTGAESTAYHIHADFLVMIDDTKLDLSDDRYMSVVKRVLSPSVHLHDNNDNVIHFHAPNISLVEFLSSLNISLTSDCLKKDDTSYCRGPEHELRLYVNDKDRTSDITSYVPRDEDRILLYYGARDDEKISKYLDEVTDKACIYSGTCPERGTPPPEECGLTCEL